MIKTKREIIFSARFEYNYNFRNQGFRLGMGPKDDNIDITVLEGDARNVISEELPAEMKHVFGIDVKTRVIATRYGSLTVFFGAIVTGYGILGGHKGLYDSIQLLRRQCDSLITQRLMNRFWENVETNVSIEYPKLPEPGFVGFIED